MDEKRKSEIAWLLLKSRVADELRFGDISNLKRELGNTSKEIGVPLDELLEFAELIIKEIFDEQIVKLRGSREQTTG